MPAIPFSLILIAQAGLLSSADARLEVCMDTARTDPPTAIVEASGWLSEEVAPYTSRPQQCLGTAYMSLLRWEAAHTAFISARDDRRSSDHRARAILGAMAGNAALAGKHYEFALSALEIAQGDAASAGLSDTGGEIAADRARALVSLHREQEARSALTYARELMPQSATIWLLSATLERRLEQLDDAQGFIVTARALVPSNGGDEDSAAADIRSEILLEAGLIAALDGRDDAARRNWRALVNSPDDSDFADKARAYLGQLDDLDAAEESAPET